MKHRLWNVSLVALMFVSMMFMPMPSAEASNRGTMTYIRFNRYGTNIYATYCVDAPLHKISWGQTTPSWWLLERTYGDLNGCVTRLFWTNVAGNETLFLELYAATILNPQDNDFNTYTFTLTPTGSSNLSCSLTSNTTFLRRDPRLISNTACAFWNS